MNEFYRKKASLPRQARNTESLAESLTAWKEFRLKNVVQACSNAEDSFRSIFGLLHEIAIKKIDAMLLSDSQEEINAAAVSWYEAIREQFETTAPSGALRDALGLTGAELEKILGLEPEISR